MLKRLPVFLLFILFSTLVDAQTPADTIVQHSPVDSVAKHLPGDSVVNHIPADSVVKHPLADSVLKHPSADSAMKHAPVKSAIKRPQPVESAVKHSPIKTISDQQYNAYLNGDDLGDMALPGELNHFPSPDKVLKFKKQLDLSPIQVGKLNQLAMVLHRKKIEMGENIIRNEKMLDSLFHSRQVEDGTLIFYTNRSGLYYGELRGAILMACYNTEKLLTDAQIKKLEELEKGK